MAKKVHSQKTDPRQMTCFNCRNGHCENCVDVLRMVYSDEMICTCTRKNHLGEPIANQIKDPESGTVYAPGLTVSELSEVAIDPTKREAFLAQFARKLEEEE